MNNWNIVIGIISLIFIALVAYQTFVVSRREEIGRISKEIIYLLEVLRDNSQPKTTVHMVTRLFIRKYNERIEDEIPRLILPKIFLRGHIDDLLGKYKTLKDEYQAQLK